MDKKCVIVTGAANGIGKAVAQQFHAMGWFVGLFDLDEQGLAALCQEIGTENCLIYKTDVTNPEQLQVAMRQFAEVTQNRLDLLVSNAGIIVQKPFEEGEIHDYQRLVEVNAFGAVNTVYAALPYLKQTPHARIVITSSSSAIYGIPDFAVYSSTKGFLRNFTEALNIELESDGIWVSDVMPLFVKTNMMNAINDKYKAKLTPQDIANAIVKASQGKKIHYLVGEMLTLTDLMHRLLPIKWFKPVLKSYLKYKK